MATTITIDRVTTLSARERHGALVGMTREVLVSGLTDGDFDALFTALDDMETDDGTLAAGSILTGHNDLVLVERNPSLVPGDPQKVLIELVYEHFQNDGQDLDNPAHGVVFIKSSTNLQQIKSQLDAAGDTISVAHTFPADDPDHPSETVTQGGEISVTESQETVVVTGIYTTDSPDDLSYQLQNHVSDRAWLGGAAGTWKCTRVEWEDYHIGATASAPVDAKFTIEFQHNASGWQPEVVYIDPRTGKPPPDLVADTGYKTVTWYLTADFASFLTLLG